MLLFCLVGIISACLTIFLNYCLGKPGSEKFSPYEIFASYTIWLSKRRLKKIGLWDKYQKLYHQGLADSKAKHQRLTYEKEFNLMLYEAADPFFTWERAAGMCPVCTGFWIALITGIIFTFQNNFWSFNNFFNLVIIIVISHVTIRILNKLL